MATKRWQFQLRHTRRHRCADGGPIWLCCHTPTPVPLQSHAHVRRPVWGCTPKTVSSVFATTDGDELQQLQDKNNKKSTNKWVNRFQRWQEYKRITGTLLELNKRQLEKPWNNSMRRFEKRMDRSMNPTAYEWCWIAILERMELLKDKASVCSCQVLNGKAIKLHESGRGTRKN